MHGFFKTTFYELINAIKFCRESKKGKYSLETYLDIIGKYVDYIIIQSEKDGLAYIGGTCIVRNDTLKQNYSFRVEMFFQDKNGRNIMKEATRCLPQKKFTSETKNKIMEETVFEINRPK